MRDHPQVSRREGMQALSGITMNTFRMDNGTFYCRQRGSTLPPLSAKGGLRQWWSDVVCPQFFQEVVGLVSWQ